MHPDKDPCPFVIWARLTVAQKRQEAEGKAVLVAPARRFGGFPKLGVPWGPHSKDHHILGCILGSPHLGKLPFSLR